MLESLEIVYTYDSGQIKTQIPLELLPNIFISKAEMERQLLLFSTVVQNSQKIDYPDFTNVVNGNLGKISTCIYSDVAPVPAWYGDWNGKFYYPETT